MRTQEIEPIKEPRENSTGPRWRIVKLNQEVWTGRVKQDTMHHTHCSSKILVCIRQQLFALFLCWLAAAGISILFIILPGCQTLRQFQSTRCTTARASRSGENPCTFCLQIHVFTEHAPLVERQLQQDEVIDDIWVRCIGGTDIRNEARVVTYMNVKVMCRKFECR